MVFGDFVIQVYIPSEIKDKLKQHFSKANDVNKLRHDRLIKEVFEKKADIQVVISKDSKIASQIKDETLKFFSKSF